MLTAKLPGKNTGLSLTENTDDLFIKKTLLYGGLLIRLMKTLHRGIQISREQVTASIRSNLYDLH
ncbi:Uncharacterised protein [Serratia proteamaculans]|nr:Uncharacterised protein [Serratia proteamaculans]